MWFYYFIFLLDVITVPSIYAQGEASEQYLSDLVRLEEIPNKTESEKRNLLVKRMIAYVGYSKENNKEGASCIHLERQKEATRLFLSAYEVNTPPLGVLKNLQAALPANSSRLLTEPSVIQLMHHLEQQPCAIQIAHAQTNTIVGASDPGYVSEIERGHTLDATSLAFRNIGLNREYEKAAVALQVYTPFHGQKNPSQETMEALVKDAKYQFALGKKTYSAVLGDGAHYVALLMTHEGDVHIVDSLQRGSPRWELFGNGLRTHLRTQLRLPQSQRLGASEHSTYLNTGAQTDAVNCGLYSQEWIRQFVSQGRDFADADRVPLQKRIEMATDGLTQARDQAGGAKTYFGRLRTGLIEDVKRLVSEAEQVHIAPPTPAHRPPPPLPVTQAQQRPATLPPVSTSIFVHRPPPPPPPVSVPVSIYRPAPLPPPLLPLLQVHLSVHRVAPPPPARGAAAACERSPRLPGLENEMEALMKSWEDAESVARAAPKTRIERLKGRVTRLFKSRGTSSSGSSSSQARSTSASLEDDDLL